MQKVLLGTLVHMNSFLLWIVPAELGTQIQNHIDHVALCHVNPIHSDFGDHGYS